MGWKLRKTPDLLVFQPEKCMMKNSLEQAKLTEPIDLHAVATAMRRFIYSANSATLVGTGAAITFALGKRMREPTIGDWVIETSTINRSRGTTDIDAIGVLEEVARENVDFNDPEFIWDEVTEGRPHPQETVHYIRTLDGRRFRWVNASFVAAPDMLPSPPSNG